MESCNRLASSNVQYLLSQQHDASFPQPTNRGTSAIFCESPSHTISQQQSTNIPLRRPHSTLLQQRHSGSKRKICFEAKEAFCKKTPTITSSNIVLQSPRVPSQSETSDQPPSSCTLLSQVHFHLEKIFSRLGVPFA